MKSNIGIHTYSVSMMLTAKQYHVIKKHLPALQIKELDYFRGTEILYSGFFEKQGVKIHLSHFQMLYQLKIQIEPCRILGNDNPAALYVPTKKSYHELVRTADDILGDCKIPRSIDKMKICRIDLTNDLYFDDDSTLMQYVQI